jgi:hypothetical protein
VGGGRTGQFKGAYSSVILSVTLGPFPPGSGKGDAAQGTRAARVGLGARGRPIAVSIASPSMSALDRLQEASGEGGSTWAPMNRVALASPVQMLAARADVQAQAIIAAMK